MNTDRSAFFRPLIINDSVATPATAAVRVQLTRICGDSISATQSHPASVGSHSAQKRRLRKRDILVRPSHAARFHGGVADRRMSRPSCCAVMRAPFLGRPGVCWCSVALGQVDRSLASSPWRYATTSDVRLHVTSTENSVTGRERTSIRDASALRP